MFETIHTHSTLTYRTALVAHMRCGYTYYFEENPLSPVVDCSSAFSPRFNGAKTKLIHSEPCVLSCLTLSVEI